jgi:hypothetical protein
MKVFLSWSKPRSRQVAEALHEWLPLVLQRIEPWMSAADLEAGVRWGQLLSDQLESTAFGIICVTPENQHEPWLHFEAGAVSKKVSHPSSRVIPLGFGLDKSAMPGPLQQFQAVNADENGIRSIVRSMHACLTEKLPDERLLNRTLDKWLPELLEAWAKIKPLEEQPPEPTFDSDDALKEMLLMMRPLTADPSTRKYKVYLEPPGIPRAILENRLFRLGVTDIEFISETKFWMTMPHTGGFEHARSILLEHGFPVVRVKQA